MIIAGYTGAQQLRHKDPLVTLNSLDAKITNFRSAAQQ